MQGISLPVAQYSTLITLLPEIEAALVAAGESVPRPDYSSLKANAEESGDADAGDETGMLGEKIKGEKKNFEATSEEDE